MYVYWETPLKLEFLPLIRLINCQNSLWGIQWYPSVPCTIHDRQLISDAILRYGILQKPFDNPGEFITKGDGWWRLNPVETLPNADDGGGKGGERLLKMSWEVFLGEDRGKFTDELERLRTLRKRNTGFERKMRQFKTCTCVLDSESVTYW